MSPNATSILVSAWVAVAGLAYTALARLPVKLTYNATQSAAVGFYAVEPPGRIAVGDQVLSRLPADVAALADARRYVPATTPVLKTVAATAGAVVCRTGARVIVDAHPVALARSADRAGRPLPMWAGCRRLGPGEVLLLGRPADSFDGRYFGPTPAALVVGRARSLWTW